MLETLSPLHIGMSSDKDYLQGFDYLYDSSTGEINFLEIDKIFSELDKREIELVSSFLANRENFKFKEFLNKKDFLRPPFIDFRKSQKIKISGDGTIKRFHLNGLGKLILPGSSVKGSIRSIFLNTLQKGKFFNEKDIFGRIDQNLMRFLQVSDADFTQTKIYPFKVFSADGKPDDGVGKWKNHRKGKHVEYFDEFEFISYYECLLPQSTSKIQINIGNDLPDNLNDYAIQNISNFQFLKKIDLVNLIKDYTNQYLKKELEYFTKFPNEDLDYIKDQFDLILNENNKENSCVFRIGANSGYHNITGDWQYNSHVFWEEKFHQIKAKTRKLAFQADEEHLDFFLPGFIKMTAISKECFDNFKPKTIDSPIQTPPPETPPKPALPKIEYYEGSIKVGTPNILAEVTKSGKPNIVKLFIKNNEAIVPLAGYSDVLAKGAIVKVKINQFSQKKGILQVGFMSFL